MLNAIVPLTLVLLDRANLSLLLGNPQTTSALYAVVFAGDLLLAGGLLVLAFKMLVRRARHAGHDRRGAIDRLAQARWRASNVNVHGARGEALGHDGSTQRQSLPGTV